MNVNDFQILQTLYEYKNITRTAEVLYLTQPTVSKRLQAIEEEFGITVAARSKTGVTFTPEGEYLAVKAAQMNAILQETRQHLSGMRKAPMQTLTIGASTGTIHGAFPDLIAKFRRLFPKIEINLVNERSTRLTQMLELGQLDFCFVNGEVTYNGARVLMWQEQAYLGSAVPMALETLPEQPYIGYISDPASRSVLEQWWRERYNVPFPVGLRVSGAEVARDLVLRSLGYSIFFRRDSGWNGVPCAKPLTYQDGSKVVRTSWCLYNGAEAEEKPAAMQFLQFIKNAS